MLSPCLIVDKAETVTLLTVYYYRCCNVHAANDIGYRTVLLVRVSEFKEYNE